MCEPCPTLDTCFVVSTTAYSLFGPCCQCWAPRGLARSDKHMAAACCELPPELKRRKSWPLMRGHSRLLPRLQKPPLDPAGAHLLFAGSLLAPPVSCPPPKRRRRRRSTSPALPDLDGLFGQSPRSSIALSPVRDLGPYWGRRCCCYSSTYRPTTCVPQGAIGPAVRRPHACGRVGASQRKSLGRYTGPAASELLPVAA